MNIARKRATAAAGVILLSPLGLSQVPDTLTSLDPGGRPMGMGGVGYITGADTFSCYFNPAGLGYLSSPRFAVAMRNLVESRTVASGDFGDPDLASEGQTGRLGLSHIGYAVPWSGRGTLGVAFTLGGHVDDTRTGNGLTSGALTVQNYRERVRVRTDFLSVGYGRATEDQTFSWGASVLYAMSGITNTQSGSLVDSANNLVGILSIDNSETATGFGVVAGVQFSPKNRPNMSFGFSYRSEINLSNNDNTSSVYDKIPARLSGGVAVRRDNLRNGQDFLVYGAEINHFFKGGDSPLLDRHEQTTGSLGVEYNYVAGFGRMPVRLGYHGVPSGGNGFGPRNTFTFGVGLRPSGSDLSVDVNFGRSESGGTDLGLSIGYRFK